MSFEEKEKHIDQLIDQNEKDQAVKLIFELIVHYATKKNFVY